MAKAKGKRNHRKEKLEFVQDYLPIRDLKNGIIETTDNRYIKILEIEPINFTLRQLCQLAEDIPHAAAVQVHYAPRGLR